jgi:hypothetical protein
MRNRIGGLLLRCRRPSLGPLEADVRVDIDRRHCLGRWLVFLGLARTANPLAFAAALDSGGFPALNTVAAISTNFLSGVYKGNGPWDTGSGQAPTCTAWNGGAFSDEFGTLGALVQLGGGDGDYWGNEVNVFPLDTLAWIRIHDPSPRCANTATFDKVHGEFDDGQPAVGHTYGALGMLPSSLGGGPKGSVIQPVAIYYHQAIYSTGWSHKCDLSTGIWTRSSSNGAVPGQEMAWAFDTLRDRFVGARTGPSVPSSSFYILGGFANGVGVHRLIPSGQYTMGNEATAVYYPDGDAFLMCGSTQVPAPGIRAWDLANGFAKYDLKLRGDPLPPCSGPGFVWCGDLKCFFLRDPRAGQEQFLWSVTPPSGNWRTEPWTVSKIRMAGARVVGNTPAGMWGRFAYARAAGCLVWVSTINTPVYAYRVR